jgi:hypothetical protein
MLAVDTGVMGTHSGDPAIIAHIELVSTRAESDADRLVSTMLSRCWPGGTGDRTEAVGVEWVRRWGPRRAGPIQSGCRCALGRCLLCN